MSCLDINASRRTWLCRVLFSACLFGFLSCDGEAQDRRARRQARKNRENDAATKDVARNDTPEEDADTPAEKPSHAKARLLVEESLSALKEVKDYQATFTKYEVIGRTKIDQTATVKVRHEPFSVYMNFTEPKDVRGREVLYVDGKNDGNLLVHEGSGLLSLVGTVSLAKDSKDIMKENRYPITDIGMLRLVEKILEQMDKDADIADDLVVKYYPNAKVAQKPAVCLEISCDKQRNGFPFSRSRIFLDQETRYPVRVQQFGIAKNGGEPPLIEEYIYTNIKVNQGFTDKDFDRRNKSYSF